MVTQSDSRGVSLLEIVVVLGLLSVVIAAVGQFNLVFLKNTAADSFSLKANYLGVETLEALRAIKEENWNSLGNLDLGAPYYLLFSVSDKKWIVTQTDPGNIDNVFSRFFVLRPVLRDSLGKIVASGGVLDNKTRLAEANINWSYKDTPKNIKISTYLADFK